MPLLSSSAAPLLRRQLIVVTGKGGVGKSLLTALLGEVLADAGRRVLLIETDPRESLHQMMGVRPSGGEIVAVRSGLFLQNLQPRRVLEQVVRERLHVELLVRRVLSSPVFDQFVEAAPGLKELAILGYALRFVRGESGPPPIDMVILDAPASGHAASLVTAPQVVSDVIREGPFGRMAGELSAFMADPELTGIVAVTRAEEMPVQEVLELRATLETRFGRGPELLVVNALLPPFPDSAIVAQSRSAPVDARRVAAGGPGWRSAEAAVQQPAAAVSPLRLWKLRRCLNDRELERLDRCWRGPRIELPLVPLDRGPALIAALRARFEQMDG